MTGKHHIVIETLRIKYEFDIRRNLTIIQGDSATGKTTLTDLLQDYARDEVNGPIRLQSDVPCVVFGGTEQNWESFIQTIKESIVFIDEGYSFIRSREFAEVIRQTDNYYVLITREALTCLPYSINEIYGIRTSGRFHYPEQIYHEFYPIYKEETECTLNKSTEPVILAEDSKSGYLFLKNCCADKECISAEGNSNIYQIIKKMPREKKMIVIADGAAFGAFIEKVLSVARYHRNIMLYLPESFEWLVLKSGIIQILNLDEILNHPESYIESSQYFSWERFFCELLEKETSDDPIRQYHKNRLTDFYLEGKNKERILEVFPEEVKVLIES